MRISVREAARIFRSADASARSANGRYALKSDCEVDCSGSDPVRMTYTNHRGEMRVLTFTPIDVWFGATPWYPEPQWILSVWDHEKDAQRDLAFSGFSTFDEGQQ